MPTGTPTKTKKCPLCGDTFLPEKPSQRYCKKDHFQPCPVCGKPVLWNSTRPVPSCSKKCKKELVRRRNVEKYGVDHPMKTRTTKEKQHRTMKERYGTAHALCNEEIKARAVKTNREKFGTDWALGSSEVHDKIKKTMTERYGAPTTLQSEQLVQRVRQTCLERYGTEFPSQTQEVKERTVRTCNALYGTDNPNQNEDIKRKMIQSRLDNNDGVYWTKEMSEKVVRTSLERYGTTNPSKSETVKERIRNTCMELYGVPWGCMAPGSELTRISKTNIAFSELLSSRGIENELEVNIGNRFFDVVVPSQRIAIEIDPSYTHNTVGMNHFGKGVSETYHLEKTQLANEHGYRCIHVFDWDDWDKIVSMIAPRTTRIGARKCGIVKIVDQKVANKFIRENHVQGQARGAVLTLGLEYDKELVMCMSFGRSRYNRKYTYELLRLCSKRGVEVVGGASKLFKFATNQMELDSIVSYCDLAKFSGNVYEKIGMTLVNRTVPNVVWSRENKHVTSNLLRQRGYDQLFNTNYGKGTDNEILMLLNGWVPVCDCGQGVYEYVSHS